MQGYTLLCVMDTPQVTTIRISKDTREKLASIGSKRDTYDKIIQKMIESRKEVC